MIVKKINLISALAVGFAVAISLSIAPKASAKSFTSTRSGVALVNYNDGQDKFCVTDRSIYGTMGFGLRPVQKGRGPSYSVILVHNGQTKCVSLARAYEDTKYYYWVSDTDWPSEEGFFFS